MRLLTRALAGEIGVAFSDEFECVWDSECGGKLIYKYSRYIFWMNKLDQKPHPGFVLTLTLFRHNSGWEVQLGIYEWLSVAGLYFQ